LENISLKGEGKNTLKDIFFIHRKQNVMEKMMRECVCNHVFIYLNPHCGFCRYRRWWAR